MTPHRLFLAARRRFSTGAAAALLGLTLLAGGCGDDAGADAGTDSAVPLDFSKVVPPDLIAAGGDGGTDAAAPPDLAPSCVADGGCWVCPPSTDRQFLNQCSGSQCARFDNRRLPLLGDGGALPPLP